MKKLVVLIALALIFTNGAFAQKKAAVNVPAAVSQAFKAKFPTATKTEWEKESETEFEVEFMNGKQEMSASFEVSGKWLKTEMEVELSTVPAEVKNAISKAYADWKIEDVEKEETHDAGTIYEFELKKGKETMDVFVSPSGKILKTEKEVSKNETEKSKK